MIPCVHRPQVKSAPKLRRSAFVMKTSRRISRRLPRGGKRDSALALGEETVWLAIGPFYCKALALF